MVARRLFETFYQATRNSFEIPLLLPFLAAITADNVFYGFLYEGQFVKNLTSATGISIFVAIILVAYVSGLPLLHRVLKRQSKKLREADYSIQIIYRLLIAVQYFVMAFLILIALEIFLESKYSLLLLIAVVMFSFSTATAVMLFMSFKLFSWYRRSRGIIILLYGISTSTFAVNTATIVGVNAVKIGLEIPEDIGTAGGAFMQIGPNSSQLVLLQITYMPFRVGYLTIWIASALLLNKYSKKLGRIKYWSLMSLPLLGFGVASILATQQSVSHSIITPFLVVITLIISAILFGGVFWMVGRSISQIAEKNGAAVYLRLSAFGVIMIVLSIISPVIYSPYPPFGITAWSFVAMASYVYSVGIYSSAVSVSQDARLRQFIRKNTMNEPKLLESMGSAQLQKEIEDRVIGVAKNASKLMVDQTGVQSSLSDDDMKYYLHEVINEIERQKPHPSDGE